NRPPRAPRCCRPVHRVCRLPLLGAASPPRAAAADHATTTTTTTVTGPAAPKPFTMRTYFMGFLRRGPKWSKERTPEAQAAGEGHMANIKRLGACGKLLIAGPFKHPADAPEQGPLAGIFLFDVATQEEAEALMRTDPAIIAGRFTMEVLPWYGPSAWTRSRGLCQLHAVHALPSKSLDSSPPVAAPAAGDSGHHLLSGQVQVR
ncbi:MAG TPA: YciI family protein, partial [Archangium sp.]|nr:YciI family protein [Archangium sp.]